MVLLFYLSKTIQTNIVLLILANQDVRTSPTDEATTKLQNNKQTIIHFPSYTSSFHSSSAPVFFLSNFAGRLQDTSLLFLFRSQLLQSKISKIRTGRSKGGFVGIRGHHHFSLKNSKSDNAVDLLVTFLNEWQNKTVEEESDVTPFIAQRSLQSGLHRAMNGGVTVWQN
jgi:hypothetical protein